jgi:hypothetical protein
VYIKGGIPYNRYRGECRRKYQAEILQWIICDGCQRGVCMQCANLIHQKIMNDDAIPNHLKHEHDWCQLVRKYQKFRPKDNEHVAVLYIPPTISHCCRLKQEVRYKRNQLSRIQKAQRKHGVKSHHSTINQFNDGLLHYAPYRVVLAPSKRFYETLCVAEQGRVGDPDHQEPVYHSVIPNQVARDYDNRNVFPNGNQSEVIIGDFYCYVPVELPFDAEPQQQFFMIRRVLIKYSSEYFSHPTNGSCCLSDEDYFRSCVKIFDEKWEDADIKNGVDVCLITGQPGPDDKGRNEILLSARIYREDFSIPFPTDSQEKENCSTSFLKSCYESIKNGCGFVTYRVGGSAGDEGATEEQLTFLKAKFNPGCFPVVAGAVLHFYVGGGKWRAYYITPYKKKKSVKIWHYSTPQVGGQFDYDKEHSDRFPSFFDRMSMVRSTFPRIVASLQESNRFIEISPRAMANQEQLNLQARYENLKSCGAISVLEVLNKQVVYSFVAYTVGNHKDVTKTGVSKELIECKAFLHWPARSVNGDKFLMAKGRGGMGPGQYTVMIVDHPKKK